MQVLSFSFHFFSLPSLCSLPKSRACSCSVSPLGGQTRIKGKIKASLRVPREAVGLPYRKHKERRNAVAFSSARYRPVEISYVSLGDRFAVVANCYGDEAVAPSYVRFTELLGSSFHCSVLRF